MLDQELIKRGYNLSVEKIKDIHHLPMLSPQVKEVDQER